MVKIKKIQKETKKVKNSPFNDYWNKYHYLLLFIGITLLIIGFFLLSLNPWSSFPSLTLAPIVLLIAYLVIFPLSIVFTKFRNKK